MSFCNFLRLPFAFLLCSTSVGVLAQSSSPVSISIYDRTRIDASQWFDASQQNNSYGYGESLLRIAIGQQIHQWEWQAELAQPSILDAPDNAVSPIAARGQLGLGATYFASNGNNTEPAAAFLKQGYLRYRFSGNGRDLRLGRFEFIEGQETHPENNSIAWLQANRIAHRLIGNFGFSNAQRSFDGLDSHWTSGAWNVTAMAGRADQGVFNMNGNPELNVDVQYLALTRSAAQQHVLWRAFAIGYHDGRTGIAKTDNRPLPVRQADHKNIRVGTYGGDVLASIPAGSGQVDLLAWGVLQNGQWGALDQSSKAAALEGGYRFSQLTTTPWLRGGYFYGSGDPNASDTKHESFFQVLPTPRIYARFPFYDSINNKDGFVQLIDHPAKKVEIRADLHWLQLSSKQDLWYLSGGAFDNKVFGYVGRPSNGHTSLASMADVSADWQVTKNLALNLYYAHVNGKSVVAAIYPTDRNAQYGYAELVYHWGIPQRKNK